MKRIILVGAIGLVVIIAIAFSSALQMGEKSPIYVSGTVEISPELIPEASGITTLFIILHDASSQMPMPFGAMKERLSADFTKPYSFKITKEGMMMMNPDAAIPPYFRVKARLDKDGVAGADQPGDLVGSLENVKSGSSSVTIKIERKIP